MRGRKAAPLLILPLLLAVFVQPIRSATERDFIWEKWVVIVGGCIDPLFPHQSLQDTVYLYDTLTKYCGIASNHIRYLFALEEPIGGIPPESYVWATKDNVRDTIRNWLGSQSDPDDTILIYFVTHGRGAYKDGTLEEGARTDLSGDEGLEHYCEANATWFGVDESLYIEVGDDHAYYDDELKEDLSNVPYENLIVLFQACASANRTGNLTCFSGGFIDDLSAPRRTIITAANETALSFMDMDDDGFSEFSEAFIDALRGNEACWDETGLIVDGLPVDADSDHNGHVSIQEAFDYAYWHDDAREAVRTKNGTEADWWPYEGTDESPWIDCDGDGLPTFINGADVLDTSQKKAIVYLDWLMGDLNNDGIVNFIDLFLFRKIYCYSYDPLADFDCDGDVDYADLYIFKQQYQKYASLQEA